MTVQRLLAARAGGRGGNPGLAVVGEDNLEWVKVFQAANIGGVIF